MQQKTLNSSNLNTEYYQLIVIEKKECPGYHGNHLVDWSGYADDLEPILQNVSGLQKALTFLNSVFPVYTTEYTSASQNRMSSEQKTQEIRNFCDVTMFKVKYL